MIKFSELNELGQRDLLRDIASSDIDDAERHNLIKNIKNDIYCCYCLFEEKDCVCDTIYRNFVKTKVWERI